MVFVPKIMWGFLESMSSRNSARLFMTDRNYTEVIREVFIQGGVTVSSQALFEDSIGSSGGVAWHKTRLEFFTSPCSLLFTKILLPRILIVFAISCFLY